MMVSPILLRAVSRVAILYAFILALAQSHAGVPGQWASRGPGGGGALFAPAISPYNSGEFYLACDMSEVFHTTNFGATWNLVDFRQLQGGRQAIVQFTTNPAVLYSIDFSGDLMTPTKSTNAGATWLQLSNEPPGGGAYCL